MRKLFNNFNAGELSPFLGARVDIEKYRSGCRTLENFLPMPYGGAMRRPGFAYLGAAKFANRKCKLIDFNFSTTTNFVIEFGHLYLRFWTAGALVEDPGSPPDPLEVVSPWTEGDLPELQYVQINDVMYITQPNYAVRKLSRLADDNWTLETVEWSHPAFRAENESTTTITASGDYHLIGGTATLTASTGIFDELHVGAYWRVGHRRGAALANIELTAVDESSPVRAFGAWEFRTTGTWDGRVDIQRSYELDNVSPIWETIRSFDSNSDRNVTATGTEEEECILRVRMTAYDAHSGSPVPYAYLEIIDSMSWGIMRIDTVTSDTVVEGTMITPIHSATATRIWQEGAWSDLRGHPRTVCLHEQRLWFGGNAANAQTLWASAVDDFEDFRVAELDTSSLEFVLASSEQNAVCWMVSQQALCVGTTGDEYTVDSGSDGTAITPTAVRVRKQSKYGSQYLQARVVADAALFVQRPGIKIREFTYNFGKDGYVSPDLSILSEHVLRSGIVQMAFQPQRDGTLWCVLGNGQLAAMTYDRDQQVTAWSRHVTDGSIESAACIYRSAANESDDVYVSVKRTINGSDVRYIEQLWPTDRAAFNEVNRQDWSYFDSFKNYLDSDLSGPTLTGLEHLEGKEVCIIADENIHDRRTVSGGEITLDFTPEVRVRVGLPFTSTLTPMPFHADLQDGPSRGRKWKTHQLSVEILNSLGGEFESSPGVWDALTTRSTIDDMDASPPVVSDILQVQVNGPYSRTGQFTIRTSTPAPMCILCVAPTADVYGD